MMKVLGTGLTGLVGSRITEILSPWFLFENISRSTGVNITNKEQVLQAVKNSSAEIVLHLAAKANVDACEQDKAQGQQGAAWQINVEGTSNIAMACEITKKKLIYVSTDFVFDGEKGEYTEKDPPNPLNWYAMTKYEGENIVQGITTPWVIMRIAYPYRAQFAKLDFMRSIKERLEKGEHIQGITDQIISPTFIDDIAQALHVIIEKNATGIYHTVGSEWVSPFDCANIIAQIYNLDKSFIEPTTRDVFFAQKAPRPFHLSLKNDKIQQLGAKMKSFAQGLEEIKKQL